MPRGTIHQAVAQTGGSTHLTISTYQNWSWANLATCMMHTALDSQGEVGKGGALWRSPSSPGFERFRSWVLIRL